jgi:hypothetical protein
MVEAEGFEKQFILYFITEIHKSTRVTTWMLVLLTQYLFILNVFFSTLSQKYESSWG